MTVQDGPAEGRRLASVISGCQNVCNPARSVNGATGCSRAASRCSIAEAVTFPIDQLRKAASWQRDAREAARVVPPWRLTRPHVLEIS